MTEFLPQLGVFLLFCLAWAAVLIGSVALGAFIQTLIFKRKDKP